MRRTLCATLATLAVATLIMVIPLSQVSAAPLQLTSWRAEYYDNPGLAGAPRIVTFVNDLSVDFGLGSPGPEIPVDNFSARFTDIRHFDEGDYLLFLTVNDGARVWIDGQLVVDAWDVGFKEERVRIRLDRTGDYEVQVAYFNQVGHASIKLDFLRLGGRTDVIEAWHAEYFLNPNLEGDPVLTRQEGAIAFDWNSGPPDVEVTRDNFSARWTRSIYLDRTGYYVFKIQHDDGMRIFVDGKIIYESWFDQPVTYNIRRIPIEAGYRTFTVEFYDHVGNATAFVMIEGDPGAFEEFAPNGAGPAGVVVDNDGPRFTWGGSVGNQFINGGGFTGSYFWTYNTDFSSVNYGQWDAPIGAEGNYEVYAYIPADRANTRSARYVIEHFNQQSERIIDQSLYSNEFVSLGIYYFKGDGDERVILTDATNEAPGTSQIAFDAIKFAPVP